MNHKNPEDAPETEELPEGWQDMHFKLHASPEYIAKAIFAANKPDKTPKTASPHSQEQPSKHPETPTHTPKDTNSR